MKQSFVIKNKTTGEYIQAEKVALLVYLKWRSGFACTNECADIEGATRYEDFDSALRDIKFYCEQAKQDESNYEVVEA